MFSINPATRTLTLRPNATCQSSKATGSVIAGCPVTVGRVFDGWHAEADEPPEDKEVDEGAVLLVCRFEKGEMTYVLLPSCLLAGKGATVSVAVVGGALGSGAGFGKAVAAPEK